MKNLPLKAPIPAREPARSLSPRVRSDHSQAKRQTRWILLGIAVAAIGTVGYLVVGEPLPLPLAGTRSDASAREAFAAGGSVGGGMGDRIRGGRPVPGPGGGGAGERPGVRAERQAGPGAGRRGRICARGAGARETRYGSVAGAGSRTRGGSGPGGAGAWWRSG
jgi:hypothetical protein